MVQFNRDSELFRIGGNASDPRQWDVEILDGRFVVVRDVRYTDQKRQNVELPRVQE